MMAKRSRVLILVASMALGLMYVLPVWKIELEAPQYPEGIGMVIRVNTIEGKKKHDLGNINNLNHYIGMKRIVPEDIPELKVMPYIVAGLMVLGGLVALLGRRKLLYGWVTLFAAISIVGMADFWKWEYDYGHNLDEETAIIKIPGMSYQPPLIGSKQILNFTAYSWPGGGGWAAILACVTGFLVAGAEWRAGRRGGGGGGESVPPEELDGSRAAPEGERAAGPGSRTGAAAVVALLLIGCGQPAPRPIQEGVDVCESCLMTVDAEGYATELVTRTGKIYTFDSIECLVNHMLHSVDERSIHSLFVTDFSHPDELVRVEDAHFLHSATLKSPMGLGITAFARAQDRDGAAHSFGGEALSWREVKELVAEAWPGGRPGSGGRASMHGGHTEQLSAAGR